MLLPSKSILRLDDKSIVATIDDEPAYSVGFMGSAIDPTLTFTRNSYAFYTNSNGLLVQVGPNIPRFDYNPNTLAPNGLLMESAATNICLYSQQLTNAAWTENNITVTDNAAIGPSGFQTASSLNVSSLTNPYLTQALNCSASTKYTLSFWVKDPNNVQPSYAIYDVTNSVFLVAATAYTTTAGWSRVSVTFTTGSTTILRLYPVRGTVNTGVLYMYGVQLEASSFASSYISTTNVSATRGGDVLKNTNLSWFNPNAGTVIVNYMFAAVPQPATNAYIYEFTDGTSNNLYLAMLAQNTQNIQANVYSGGTGNYSNSMATSCVANTPYATAFSYNATTAAVSSNNSAVFSAGVTPPVGLNRLDLGSNIGAQQINGWIQGFEYYNYNVTNAQLQAIS